MNLIDYVIYGAKSILNNLKSYDVSKLSELQRSEVAALIQPILPGGYVLPDLKYRLPTDDLIKNLFAEWSNWRKLQNTKYSELFDCDNFALDFAAYISRKRLGICVGFIHYTKPDGTSHAEGYYINSERKHQLIEPQYSYPDIRYLDSTKKVRVIYLQGYK